MIRAKVTNIQTEAVYDGTVYTQTVTVECCDGTELELFDTTVPDATVEDVGEFLDLEVVALPRTLSDNPDPDSNCFVTPLNGGYEIIGLPLNAFTEADSTVELETDIGTIGLALTELQDEDIQGQQGPPFSKIELFAYRLDLKGIER